MRTTTQTEPRFRQHKEGGMIITENLTIDGRQFVKRYSDSGVKIQRQDGLLFEDAVDPVDQNRTYTETDIPIDSDGTAEEVLNVLLGGES